MTNAGKNPKNDNHIRRRFLWLSIQVFTIVVALVGGLPSHARLESQTALFNNLPRVALLVKEQYVDPKRINPDAMLASILESLESRIAKLVVTLPKSLANVLELMRATDEKEIARLKAKADAANAVPKAVSPDAAKSDADSKNAIPSDAAKNAADAKNAAPSGAAKKAADANNAAAADAAKKAAADAKNTKGAAPKEQLVIDLGGVKKSFDYEPQRSIWGMIFLLRDVFKFVEAEAKKQGLTEKSKSGEDPIEWDKIETGAINAMLSTLDPHSVFLEAKFARDLTLTTKGEFGGIGIVISIRDGFLTVISPIDGTPAAVAGVKAKDRIVKIDDDSAINMDLNDAVNLMRGKPGTSVRITVQREKSPKEIEMVLTRAIIKVDSVAYALMDNNVGYLRIKAFQGNTAVDVKEGILALKKKSSNKMSGLVLDLRGNPGGLLREAVEVSSLFLNGGEVVSTQGSRADSRQVEMASSSELDPKMKIVVLADGGSASASEIVAGALKSGGPNAGRAIVVGERTFGKGSVQMLFDFPSTDIEDKKGKPVEPAALKLTIAEYFGPNNTGMQNIGVVPDIGLTAVFAEKPEELSLFQDTTRREVDLEGHLATDVNVKNNANDQPLMNIDYLAPKADEEAEYGKLDLAKLKKDFAVTVAQELLKASPGVLRSDLLAKADSIKVKLEAEQQKKIADALKKFAIDWSHGKSTAKAELKSFVMENKATLAGNKLNLSLKVKNVSAEPLYQVHGITHSKTALFDQREFLFGKLNPGQEITRSVEFEIPKDVVARKDLLSVELRDYRREKITESDVPIEIKGLGRPRFAHLIYIDDSAGNGDGRVENGEDVEVTVWLKNIGDGKAFEPTVLLRNESGSKVFLKNGRFQTGELLPGQETSTKFSFRIKEPTENVAFELQIFDGQMHDIWRDKIVIDTATKLNTKAISRTVALKDKMAWITTKPDENSQKIASLKAGVHMEAVKEINNFYLVKIDNNLSGFINKARVADVPKAAAAQKKADFYTINYARTPAQVALKFGDGSGFSKQESGKLVADINDAAKISSVMLYVNGKKILYRDIAKSVGKQKIESTIVLKPGVNIISLFAREDATYGQRENITVYYDEDGRVTTALEKIQAKEPQPKEAKAH